MQQVSRLALPVVAGLVLLVLTTCGKDSPTKPAPPVPAGIMIVPSTATLTAIGQTVQLTASVVDQNDTTIAEAAVVWTSSDTLIATVSAEGVVTARKNGDARITATSGGVSASAGITVSQTVARIIITPSSVTLTTAQRTVQLEAVVLDQNDMPVTEAILVWASSDTTVAAVDAEGLVTALNNGDARITATSGIVSESADVSVMGLNPDRDALAALYNEAAGPDWAIRTNWLSDVPLGEWHGVTTDADGRVTSLRLDRNNLNGPIPAVLGTLEKLEELWLTENQLTGSIPPELGRLASLSQLALAANQLTGTIPPELGRLTNLSQLALAANQLTGTIPPELGRLTNLQFLVLTFNQLTGPIPPELGRLANLQQLELSFNQFTGNIPPEFGQLTKLQFLGISRNGAMSGPLPQALTSLSLDAMWMDGTNLCAPLNPEFQAWLSGIQSIQVANCTGPDRGALIALYSGTGGMTWKDTTNWLSGAPLNDWHGVTTDTNGRVTALNLENNDLEGSLPHQLSGLSHLKTLNLMNNAALIGPLPQALTSLNLDALHLNGTRLCAPLDAEFQDWLSGIPDQLVPICADVIEPDRAALAVLYGGTGGPNWTTRTNWLSEAPLDEWYGVTTDADGRVTTLSLEYNNMRGPLPSELGRMDRLEQLNLHGNGLTGNIPPEIGQLDKLILLNISNNLLDGSISPDLGQLDALTSLRLDFNQLVGTIPSDLGQLNELTVLKLDFNQLIGAIPPELGQLNQLTELSLSGNLLTGPIPAVLGQLNKLTVLNISFNLLSGTIPPELGQLANLRHLVIFATRLTGAIPPELGQLRELTELNLDSNLLTGAIPPILGQLDKLAGLNLDSNQLTGVIPPELGQLEELVVLSLAANQLTGPVPPELGGLVNLKTLSLTGNALSGPLPLALTGLALESLLLDGTQLCAPPDAEIQAWVQEIPERRVSACVPVNVPPAYLTQATQSLRNPVPLVAGDPALLRVFVTAAADVDATMPQVLATFYQNDAVVYTADIPAQATRVPDEPGEGDLSASANEEIPGSVVQPGLEMVVEIDPDGELDPASGIGRRIPPTGRLAMNVKEVPRFDLTMVPFLWLENPDRSVLAATENLTADDDLFRMTRDILPVGDFQLDIREPVWTSVEPVVENATALINEVIVIRVMDGTGGHFMGILNTSGGLAAYPGHESVSPLDARVIAHELGHNVNLRHAPCGDPDGVDPDYPYGDGSIGAWGHDIQSSTLVGPETFDLMSYCQPGWISDYHFTKALLYRQSQEITLASVNTFSTGNLLVWGGVNERGALELQPAFVVDAPAALPQASGPYQLTGHGRDGSTLFTLSFGVAEIADGAGAAFAFILPVQTDWPVILEGITLSGPEGSVTIDGEGDSAAALMLDGASGSVRGILRDWPNSTMTTQAARRVVPEPGLEITISNGIPNADSW